MFKPVCHNKNVSNIPADSSSDETVEIGAKKVTHVHPICEITWLIALYSVPKSRKSDKWERSVGQKLPPNPDLNNRYCRWRWCQKHPSHEQSLMTDGLEILDVFEENRILNTCVLNTRLENIVDYNRHMAWNLYVFTHHYKMWKSGTLYLARFMPFQQNASLFLQNASK